MSYKQRLVDILLQVEGTRSQAIERFLRINHISCLYDRIFLFNNWLYRSLGVEIEHCSRTHDLAVELG